MPNDASRALLQRAVALHQQGQLEAALALYQQVLADDPRQFDALHLSGVLARQRGDAAGAVALIERAIAIDGDQARAHANLGAAQSDQGQTAAALRSYERALALDPNYALAHSNRGNALRLLGRLDEAIASYGRALELNPAAFDAASARAMAFNDLGRHAEALRSAEQALALRPADVEAWAARGNALFGLGRFGDALACFERAAQTGGARADLAGWRGGALTKLGRLDEALASFEASLALRPDHAGTALRRAHALDALGRRGAAIAAFEQALALGADAVEVRFALAALGQTPAPAAAPAAYVTALFDQYAGHFEQHLVQQLDYRTPQLIGAALARTGGGSGLYTVDLGCGTGLCAPLLRPLSARLAGVDLSAAMLARARARAVYDDLACADITAWLAPHEATFDLIVAADVLVYIGELAPLFKLVRQALRGGGRFCFSIELAEGDNFVLQASRRYAHSAAHIATLAHTNGFDIIDSARAMLRSERGARIEGAVLTLRVSNDETDA